MNQISINVELFSPAGASVNIILAIDYENDSMFEAIAAAVKYMEDGLAPHGFTSNWDDDKKPKRGIDRRCAVDKKNGVLRIFPRYLDGAEGFSKFESSLDTITMTEGIKFTKMMPKESREAGWDGLQYIIPVSFYEEFMDVFIEYRLANTEEVMCISVHDKGIEQRCAEYAKSHYNGFVFSSTDFKSPDFSAAIKSVTNKYGYITIADIMKEIDNYVRQRI